MYNSILKFLCFFNCLLSALSTEAVNVKSKQGNGNSVALKDEAVVTTPNSVNSRRRRPWRRDTQNLNSNGTRNSTVNSDGQDKVQEDVPIGGPTGPSKDDLDQVDLPNDGPDVPKTGDNSQGEESSNGTNGLTGENNTSPIVQYTPDQADWDWMNQAIANVPSVIDHSPDGNKLVKSWPSWNGTIINLKGLTGKQVQSAICERGIIRGTRELYYEKPFADPKAPTKAEVDDLHIRTIRHIRKMVGIDQLVPVSFDRCLCSIALWSAQLHSTSIWDAKYPDAKKTNCFTGPLCDFAPNLEDQTHTFNGVRNNQTCTTAMTRSEGFGGTNADIPWSFKFHRPICQFLSAGTTSIAGPIFRRELLCPNFFISEIEISVDMRLKAGGKLHDVLPFDS